MTSDHVVRAVIRAELGPEVFARRPWRAFLMIPLFALDIGMMLLLVRVAMPWYFAAPLVFLLGNLRAAMMFHGHEVTHGATVRSRWLQDLLAFPGCASFLFSPYTWRIWHNQSHHGHTNQPGKEPDNFGTLEEFHESPPHRRWYMKLAPGAGHWPSVFYLFVFFTLQAQSVVWSKSKRLPGYEHFNRTRARTESILLLAYWLTISWLAGFRGALLAVVLPLAIANVVILAYVLTNHMLRPLRETEDTLTTTMSVNTVRVLDEMHFHFSHHVEHHLFPAVCSHQMPRIRRVLREKFGDRYLSPPHWRAFGMIFRTPRVYDGLDVFVDPWTGRRQEIAAVETVLRGSMRGDEDLRPASSRAS